MSYKRITSVEVFNFMVYTHAVINFDKGNIINIKGYNSGGKSTMLKAIAVCLMNMYPKAQTKFIRHGEKYFRVVVRFEDGVAILRDKYISGQSLYEVYKDDECVFTTKEGGRLTKVDGVPQFVQDYLGLCVVSTGCLNYQVRQDPLWLIETTGSENYNSLNEILKTEEISRANTLLNSDKNKLNSEITSTEASLQEVKLSLLDIKDYTDELLVNLERKEAYCKELSLKYRELKGISSIISELSALVDIPYVEKADSVRLEAISDIVSTIDTVNSMVEYPSIGTIDVEKLNSILAVENTVSSLSKISKDVIPEVEAIDVESISMLCDIVAILSDVKKCNEGIKTLKANNTKVNNKLEKVVSEAKKQGIEFVKCTNCGTYVEVNV